MRRKNWLWAGLLALFTLIALTAGSRVSASDTQFVHDPANVLSTKTKQQVQRINDDSFAKLPGKPQLAVEVYQHYPNNEDNIEDLAADRFNKLGIGRKGWDNGLLFVIVLKKHAYRLEVGYGLEAALPDGMKDQIVTSRQTKLLKADRYDQAIREITANVNTQLVKHQSAIQTPSDIKTARAQKRAQTRFWTIFCTALAAFLILLWLNRKRRSKKLQKRVAQDPSLTADLTLYRHLPHSAQEDFQQSLKAPWFHAITPELIPARFANYTRKHADDWLFDYKPATFYPLYVYATYAYDFSDSKLIGLNSLAELAALQDDQLADDMKVFAPYESGFEDWRKQAKHLTMDETSQVYKEFMDHVQPQDKLSGNKLAKVLSGILMNIRHPDQQQHYGSDMPLWMTTYYAGSSSSSSSSNYGSGFGGGSSGGGGFSGGW